MHDLVPVRRIAKIALLFFAPILLTALVAISCQQASGPTETQQAAAAVSAAESRMQGILADLHRKTYHPDNIYSSEARIAFCDSVIAANPDMTMQLEYKFIKAGALLEYGDEATAVSIYEELLKLVGDNPAHRKTVYSGLGIAYLRLAERNNCVNQHMADACIFPIRGNGVHRDKTGSRKAIEVFQALLEADPNDLDSRWLLNVAYMTLGEYPVQVPARWLIPGLDDPGPHPVNPFVDVSGPLKVSVNNRAGGSITDDFDNDGYLDIVTSAWGLDDPMHFFRNNGDGTFSDWSARSGLSAIMGGLNLTSTDYNNDGWLDIFVLRGGWQGQVGYDFGSQPKSLLRNNGDGTFTDVTIDAGLLSTHPTQTATWNDFNNDGWLDVFIGHETMSKEEIHPCEFYINNRNGTFTNVAAAVGLNVVGFVKGVTSGDYNNDGWVDIFISTMDGRKFLLRNKSGDPEHVLTFENVTEKAGFGKDKTSRTFGTWFFDYDNDGWLDVLFCNYDLSKPLSYYAAREALNPTTDRVGKVHLYHNNRNGTFTDVSARMGLNQVAFAMGNNFGDIDNDGWLDFYLATGNPNYRSLVPNKLYLNLGGKKFADVTNSARVGHLQKGHAVSFADLDNDGDQDIHVDLGGAYRGDAYPSALYLNPGQKPNNWICLKLEGVQTNRAAIGARIILKFRENGQQRIIYREVNTGGSFGCSPLRREIGIGQATVIDEILVQWPGSNTQFLLKNVAPNQFLKIKEGDARVTPVPLRKLSFPLTGPGITMCAPTTPEQPPK